MADERQGRRKSLIAKVLAVVVVFALTHTVFSGLTEPAPLVWSAVAGAVVGGVLRAVRARG
ncbi:hypothetical protein ACIQU1_30955 [Streptomyces angustmyceticus]|uniref:hypothetical protein n=1 Tax=Streptomyces angustmyceticus TaxID=285578 RepID=UPI00382BF803